jgi:hypothetical protein
MRVCLSVLAAVVSLWAGESPAGTLLTGTLHVAAGRPPAIETAAHKSIRVEGDDDTTKILHDVRLDGFQVQAKGRFTAPDRFRIDPIHTRALVAKRDGKIQLITYYCDVCSIRANIPGPCACCQRETTLELIDPGQR